MSLSRAHAEDAELVRRARAGEESGFTEIVRRYQPRLLAFARRMLAGRSEYAEDVVQEALMRAHRALRRDPREMRLAPWLFALTRNCCLDELSRLRGDTLELDEREGEQLLVDRRSPDVVAEGRAGLREMLDAIATLPSEQRHALVRREVDGASYAQVADELGVSTQATRALVHRARRSLVAYRTAAATDVCATAQADLIKAHRTGRRASHATHRHLVMCSSCRAYRTRLRALRRSLHTMHPGPALAAVAVRLESAPGKLGALAGRLARNHGNGRAKLGGGAGRLGRHLTAVGEHAGDSPGRLGGIAGAGAAGAKTAIGAAGVVAALGAAAVGGTLVFGAGERSPLTVTSAAVPGGTVHAGAPLPAGTAIVARTVRLHAGQAHVTLACPAGERVADLLPPGDPAVSAGYAADTIPGTSATAHVALLATGSTKPTVAVAILCRRVQPDGAFVPLAGAGAARASQLLSTCVAHAFLLDRADGHPEGSVSLGQPLLALSQRRGWRQVRTQFSETGWLPQGDTCGGGAAGR